MISYSCITLENCQSGDPVYISTLTGSDVFIFFQAQVGNIVEILDPENFPDTYYLVNTICSIFDSTPGTDCETCFNNAVTVSVENLATTELEECPKTTAYVLVNCSAGNITIDAPADLVQNPNTVLVTSSYLQLYVGSVVNILEYPDNCYTVFGPYDEDTGCPCTEYTVTNSYPDCECCIPDTTPKYQTTVLNPVKVFYRILQSQCDIKANVRFADGYYRYYRHISQGVAICCDNVDLDKLWLKKELSDLNSIYDPSACIPPPEPEEPFTCDGVLGIPEE